MMSERKSIENSRKRYQTFITSERKPKNVPTAAAATLSPAAILPVAATLSSAAAVANLSLKKAVAANL